MKSSINDDTIEIELSTDSESNLRTGNQSEAQDASNPLNVAHELFEKKTKESEQETSKKQEKANKVAEGGGAFSSKPTEYTGKKQ